MLEPGEASNDIVYNAILCLWAIATAEKKIE